MNYRTIINTLGRVLLIFAVLMLLPMAAGIWYGENVLNFIITIVLTAAVGFGMKSVKSPRREIFAREGFVLVGLSWIVMGLFGALPFVICGDIPSYIDAVFETVSGLTTTGASIVTDIEGLTKGCLFWRSFTHWIGGMGVLVFMMAILPMDNRRNMHIMRAEVPGPTVGKLVPRLRDTAKILYIIYTAFTVIEAILLMLGGMSFMDAILHAFATAGTGGFSTHGEGLAYFDSAYIDAVVTIFLVLFGANFNLYYFIIIRRWRDALKSEELHVYFAIIAIGTALFALGTHNLYGARTLRYSILMVLNTMSTAGFTVVDYNVWPGFTQFFIVLLMFIGGCAGSTGGGLKLSRVMLLVKSAYVDLIQSIHPRAVRQVRIEGKKVDSSAIRPLYSYFIIYFLILLACGFILSFDGYDFATCFSASLSCISNVGPGLNLVGPMGGYTIFSDVSKIAMTLTMLIGRLEIYPIIILFSTSVWKRNRIN